MRTKIMKSKSRSRPKTRRSSRKKSGGFLDSLFNDDLPWHKKFTTSLTNLFSSDKETEKTIVTENKAPVNKAPAPVNNALAPVNNAPTTDPALAPVNNDQVSDDAEWYTPPLVPDNAAGAKMSGLPAPAQAPAQTQAPALQNQFGSPNAPATGGRRRTSNKRNKNKHNKNKRK
jgi:hypothetical protein